MSYFLHSLALLASGGVAPDPGGPPPGFTGPVPGQTFEDDDTRWVMLSGNLEYYAHPAYSQGSCHYIPQFQDGEREIVCFVGTGGLEVWCGDTAYLAYDLEFWNEAGTQLIRSEFFQVTSGQFGGVNSLVLLVSGLAAAVYRVRVHARASFNGHALMDKYVLR